MRSGSALCHLDPAARLKWSSLMVEIMQREEVRTGEH